MPLPSRAVSTRRAAGKWTRNSWPPRQVPLITHASRSAFTFKPLGASTDPSCVPGTLDFQAVDPHLGLDGLRRLQADGEAVGRFRAGPLFQVAAGTGEGGVAVNRQVDEQAARAAGDGAAGDIDHRARPVFAAAPPRFLAQALEGHRLAVNLVQETVAGAAVGELLVDEMVLQGAFGRVQVAALAGQAPQREVEPQPVGLGAAFVAVALWSRASP